MAKRDHIPLFPLSLVLFPQEVLPLHIFEDRYKKMVSFCLAEGVPFGVVGLEGDRMEAVGCTARIRGVLKQNEDETLDIETVGESRFRVLNLFNDHPYATAEVDLLTDEEDSDAGADRERLVAQHMKLMELVGETIRPSAYAEPHLLSFRIGASSGLDFAQRQKLLEINSEAERISHLVHHLREFIPRVQSVQERRDRIRSNGHFS